MTWEVAVTKKFKRRSALIIGFWMVLAAGATLGAQATAQISGTVRDNGGGVLPGADVTVTNANGRLSQHRHGRE